MNEPARHVKNPKGAVRWAVCVTRVVASLGKRNHKHAGLCLVDLKEAGHGGSSSLGGCGRQATADSTSKPRPIDAARATAANRCGAREPREIPRLRQGSLNQFPLALSAFVAFPVTC